MRVALLDDYQDVALRLVDWSALGPESEVVALHEHIADKDALVSALAGFDVVMAMRERTAFPRDVLERLPDLRLIVTAGMGNRVIDVDAARELGKTVCGTRVHGRGTAELTWGLIISLLRNIPREHAAVLDGKWQVSLGVPLEGSVLGVIGLGNLGSAVARVANAFDMEVLAWSENLTADRATAAGATLVSKDELLRRADVVTVHQVLSRRTRGLLGAAELALMKPTAYLVNTSRGPIVDELALAEALREGRIAGAGLDVFDVEPLPADHPFRQLDNILLTPHIGYVTRDTYSLWYGDAIEDIWAFYAGTPVRELGGRPA
ncbi:MAG: D-2-hydroxyacid dehydrogenase family protein [Dehalococcoidia bacterium]